MYIKERRKFLLVPSDSTVMVKVLGTCEPWNVPWCVDRLVRRAYLLRFRGYNTTRPKQHTATIRRMSCAPSLDSYVPKLASSGQGSWQASGVLCGSTDVNACGQTPACCCDTWHPYNQSCSRVLLLPSNSTIQWTRWAPAKAWNIGCLVGRSERRACVVWIKFLSET